MTFDYAGFTEYLTGRRTLSQKYADYLTRRLKDCHQLGIRTDADVDDILGGLRRTSQGNYRAALDYEGDFLTAIGRQENACALCAEECLYLDDARVCPAVSTAALEDLVSVEAE